MRPTTNTRPFFNFNPNLGRHFGGQSRGAFGKSMGQIRSNMQMPIRPVNPSLASLTTLNMMKPVVPSRSMGMMMNPMKPMRPIIQGRPMVQGRPIIQGRPIVQGRPLVQGRPMAPGRSINQIQIQSMGHGNGMTSFNQMSSMSHINSIKMKNPKQRMEGQSFGFPKSQLLMGQNINKRMV
jgi:hypothetical protein